ncbi:MAG: TIR domain-containing protein [Aggregatilineales bacterium]
MAKLFVVYRHQDAGGMAQQIINALMPVFGVDDMYTSTQNPPPGADKRTVTAQWARESDVMLVVIGRGWVQDARLQYPDDTIRIAIETALRGNKTVIPVLVHGAVMPQVQQLPQSLQSLTHRGVLNMRDEPDFQRDMARLIDTIRQARAAAQQKAAAQIQRPQPVYTPPPQRPPAQPAKSHNRDDDGTGIGMQMAGFAGRGMLGGLWWVITVPFRAIFWLVSAILQQVVHSTVSLIITILFFVVLIGGIAFFVVNFIGNNFDFAMTLTAIGEQIQGLFGG